MNGQPHAAGTPAPSRLEKLLNVVTVVRGGEGVAALLLAFNFFILLTSYYLLKTVREALILTESGAEVKTYSAAGQALLLLLAVPLFGMLASRVNRVQLIQAVTLFFASNLVVFYVLGMAGVHEGVVYFLWVGIFNTLGIAQFWAFANDLYQPEQGKRLFPLIGLGASLGAWLGAVLSGRLIAKLGPYPLMLISAGLLVVCVFVTRYIHHAAARNHTQAESEAAEKPLGKEGGFGLIMRDRYLLLIAVVTVLLNIINTSGEFILGKIVTEAAVQAFPGGNEMFEAREKFVGAFYGDYFGWANLLGLLLQSFAVSRIIGVIGVGGALMVGPMLAMAGYSLMAWAPALGVIRVLKILDNSNDYSLQKTAMQALFLPTSREAKYKAKTAIDSFFMRLGDMTQAGIVYAGTAMSLSIAAFSGLNVILTVCWIGTVWRLRKELRVKMGE
ncbi:MAG: MFS transporter [Acidobacteria bacterium]|nr:MFS transporter [Acidobacteriota bacterium]